MPLDEAQIVTTVETAIQNALAPQASPANNVIAGAVERAVRASAEASRDPYRVPIHFFGGGITICIALVAALLTGLGAVYGKSDSAVQMIGGALAWTAFAFLVSLICITIVQFMKFVPPPAPGVTRTISARRRWVLRTMMFLSTLAAAPIFFFALLGGSALLNTSATALPGFIAAIKGLF